MHSLRTEASSGHVLAPLSRLRLCTTGTGFKRPLRNWPLDGSLLNSMFKCTPSTRELLRLRFLRFAALSLYDCHSPSVIALLRVL
ncbi:hypothetical protein CSUI_000442 [Cystoisospora suis]|uniref:Uncharacterized protein n=1 Tax=Cystoisospora suis TaxID=483139 RepID=A0A2C6KNY0_9APIC|nr:hypothetical protein CSUI_000442 [Cystoisospora suis]